MWAILRKWRFLFLGAAAIVILAWVANFLDPIFLHWYEERKALADLSVPNWRRFTNNECGFVVEFPSKPFENPYTLSNRQNVISYRQFASTLARDQVFMVATLATSVTNNYSDEQTELLLDTAAKGLLKEGGQLLSEREISLGKFPGKEVEIIMTNGNFATMRFYQVEHDLQEVIVTVPSADRRSTNISYFLNSFNTLSNRFVLK
jgi:hypothetical protein